MRVFKADCLSLLQRGMQLISADIGCASSCPSGLFTSSEFMFQQMMTDCCQNLCLPSKEQSAVSHPV